MSRTHFLPHFFRDVRLGAPRTHLTLAPEHDDESRLHAAYAWLSRSIHQTGGQGSSKGYSYLKGWMSAYPETSGYIISSLLAYAGAFQHLEAQQHAYALGQWLLERQNMDGGFSSRQTATGGASLVFDTGMVLQGLTDLYRHGGDPAFLQAAQRCARFLSATQAEDGSWHNCYNNIPHAYHARVSWPLLDYAIYQKDERALLAAKKNFSWVMAQQGANGYWQQAHFTPKRPFANTHSLGYILEGFLEAYRILPENDWLERSQPVADRLMAVLEERGFLPGYFNAGWQEQRILPFSFACLTGSVQIARCWYLLAQISGQKRYQQAADLGLRIALAYQDIQTHDEDICGALPGSAPFFGGYLPLQFPNWATKFLMDALLERRKLH